MNIIAIINQKGGVGKTATACNLAHCFALSGKRTLLIDLDPSANASRIFSSDKYYHDFSVKDFLLNKNICNTAIDYCQQGEESISSLRMIRSNIKLALADRDLSNRPFRETLLIKNLDRLDKTEKSDVIILDCPPTLSTLTINAMFAATLILIPITYSKDSLEGVADLFNLLDEIKDGHTYDIKILRNQYDARKRIANNYIQEKLQPFQSMVLNTVIRQDEEVNRASLENLTAISYSSKTNSAAEDYYNLAKELEGLISVRD